MTYEKQGSFGSSLLYGNWDAAIWIRAKVRLVPVEPGVFRGDCDAFRVRGRKERLEEELAFGGMNKGHFQDLLDEAVTRLKPPPQKDEKVPGK